jgi:RNA polymerase sigma-70 factor (ECF subfamily)
MNTVVSKPSTDHSPAVLPDEILTAYVRQAQSGDRQATDELVKATYRMVRKIAAPLLPESAVDDAVQETYLLVIQKLHHLQRPEAFRGWLSRIALHVCYGWRRKARPTEPLQPDHAVAPGVTTSGTLDLRAALETLPARDRDILILREYLGLSYEELADALSLADGTVRSRLFHARKKLKALLEETFPTQSPDAL